ncbi:MAG: hypothetical protein E3J35_06970 [Methanomassiliicoccales archaeon]|nr:MAG: hypothetical protein E3J35_06970 [Methanomassiliicoccales archaeon]
MIESIVSDWLPYRRALRDRDRRVFDALMTKARMHTSASSYANRMEPLESVFMSILLEQQKEIELLKMRLEGKQ